MPFIRRPKRAILIPPLHLTLKDDDKVLVVETVGTLIISGMTPSNLTEKLGLAMKLASAILGGDSHPAFNPLVEIFSGAMEFGASVEKLDFMTRENKVITTYKVARGKAVALSNFPMEKRVGEKSYTTQIRNGSITYTGSFLFSAEHVGLKDNRSLFAAGEGLRESPDMAQAREAFAGSLPKGKNESSRK
ncbi:matrix protein [Snakehead rhabdovirus]|uniref:Matrix protein n=1 Tax=Snakehead rhabdovirus TaxID=103603 RepID=MATRX_SHRV|nr:matrix protein [Snakehead virus]Q9QJT7.1 RecName: Full=Matrix protein [Snakehead virus]AAD56768.1 matrix protein [Snakehead virus]